MDDYTNTKIMCGRNKTPVIPTKCVDPAVGLSASTSTGHIPPPASLGDDSNKKSRPDWDTSQKMLIQVMLR